MPAKAKSKEISYRTVCEAKSPTEMRYLFSILMRQTGKLPNSRGVSYKQRRKIQLSNVGYFAGYYDSKVKNRVRNWLGAKHPIFG